MDLDGRVYCARQTADIDLNEIFISYRLCVLSQPCSSQSSQQRTPLLYRGSINVHREDSTTLLFDGGA